MDVEERSTTGKLPTIPIGGLEWRFGGKLVDYGDALKEMEKRVDAIYRHEAPELIWLLEHPPLITAGTSAKEEDLLEPHRFPVFDAGRGGQYTYHGPGQRIAYCLLDLRKRGRDLKLFVHRLEAWMIAVLKELGVEGERRQGRVGIWVRRGQGEAKIGAIGVRVRHWVTFHGLSLNVRPDLSHFDAIVPCGVHEHGVVSLAELGVKIEPQEIDELFCRHFGNVFDG